MRISTNYIFENSRRVMQQSIRNLLDTQEIMATQKKVNHLSDDPVAAGKILDASAMIVQHEQFIRNLDNGRTYSYLYDGAIDTLHTSLTRAKELLLSQANSASSTEQTREACRVEMVSLASQIVAVGNLQYADRFLFSGYSDTEPPFLDLYATVTPDPGNTGGAAITYNDISDPALVTGDDYTITFTAPNAYEIFNTSTGTPVAAGAYTSGADISFDGITLQLSDSPNPPAAGDVFTVTSTPAGEYVGDTGIIRHEIEPDVFEQVNLTGDRVFKGVGVPDGVDVFEIFERANVALRENDQAEINALLEEFDLALKQAATQQSLVGAKQRLFEKTEARTLDIKLEIESLQTELRDIDVTEAITNLSKQENAYQAVLSATGKILQPNLLDFLR